MSTIIIAIICLTRSSRIPPLSQGKRILRRLRGSAHQRRNAPIATGHQ